SRGRRGDREEGPRERRHPGRRAGRLEGRGQRGRGIGTGNSAQAPSAHTARQDSPLIFGLGGAAPRSTAAFRWGRPFFAPAGNGKNGGRRAWSCSSDRATPVALAVMGATGVARSIEVFFGGR